MKLSVFVLTVVGCLLSGGLIAEEKEDEDEEDPGIEEIVVIGQSLQEGCSPSEANNYCGMGNQLDIVEWMETQDQLTVGVDYTTAYQPDEQFVGPCRENEVSNEDGTGCVSKYGRKNKPNCDPAIDTCYLVRDACTWGLKGMLVFNTQHLRYML